MAKKKHGKRGHAGTLERKLLGEILRRHPDILHVLDKHGVSFCAGCYLTLFSPVEKVAAYHAVPNRKRFLSDLRRVLGANT